MKLRFWSAVSAGHNCQDCSMPTAAASEPPKPPSNHEDTATSRFRGGQRCHGVLGGFGISFGAVQEADKSSA
jgi:hypothetical protein